ncbi:MAG: ATP-binding protein [Planctomycetota bacterium]|nr:ATP-binding protein [Planctomycetota bacterium]
MKSDAKHLGDIADNLRRQIVAGSLRGGATLGAEDIAQLEAVASHLEGAGAEISRQAAALAAASEYDDIFLSNLSHELRTPLTPALLLVSALQKNPEIPNDIREDLGLVREQIDLEVQLVNDLLDSHSLMRGKLKLRLENLDLHALLSSLIAVNRSVLSHGPAISLDYRARWKRIHGDPERLRQAFSNLLSNAIKFTPLKGRVDVVVLEGPPEGPRAADSVIVEVRDTGRGFGPDSLPTLFLPFKQTEEMLSRRAGGLGLGLQIARGLVWLHDGELTANSPGPGLGSTFSMRLAAIRTVTVEVSRDLAAVGPVPRAAFRVLVVEDDGQTMQATARLLTNSGYDVQTAVRYTEAVSLISSRPFDLLLSDIDLPDGTGWDLMRHARKNGRVAGLALSGYGSDDHIRRSREAGFGAHLVKPITFGRLMEAIETVLQNPIKREIAPDENV